MGGLKMKKIIIAAALLAAVCVPVAASAKGIGPSGNVALKFWMANIRMDGEKTRQNFKPMYSLKWDVMPQWSIVGEYGKSDGHQVEPPDPPDYTRRSSRFLNISARYNLKYPGAYATIGQQNYKMEALSNMVGNNLIANIRNYRIGGGISQKLPMTGWTAHGEVGVGFSGRVKYRTPAEGVVSGNAKAYDYDIGFNYKPWLPRVQANMGYRQFKFKTDAVSTIPSNEFMIKGLYFGLEMSI
jgi:hypothetical protein